MSNMVQYAYWYILFLKANLPEWAYSMGLEEYLI
jgi:hypothetical protein